LGAYGAVSGISPRFMTKSPISENPFRHGTAFRWAKPAAPFVNIPLEVNAENGLLTLLDQIGKHFAKCTSCMRSIELPVPIRVSTIIMPDWMACTTKYLDQSIKTGRTLLDNDYAEI
jgi:hypothetical protein